ncbi:hypothetical protein ACWIUD_03220 [Helicobacter sp. 23-1044]
MKRILLILGIFSAFCFAASETKTTIGYSWTRLDKASYHAIELGTSVVAITKKGTVRPYTGAEISVPLFFDDKGSNQAQGVEYEKGKGFGTGLQVPLVFGLKIGGFYLQAMAGYNLNWFSEALKNAPRGAQIGTIKKTKTKTISHGYIYGGGIGFDFNMNLTIGLRYIRGAMQNEVENPTDGMFPKYKTNYEKIYALIGYKF